MLDRLKSFLGEIRRPGSTTTLGLNSVLEDRPISTQVPQPPSEAAAKAKPAELPEFGPFGVSFAVDDVVPARDPLWQGSLAESAEIRAQARILATPDGDLPCLAPEGYREGVVPGEAQTPLRTLTKRLSLTGSVSVAQQIAKSQTFLHPLVQAVHLAFSQHRPLVLSPDSIWLTIVQGFSHHVHENAEELRGRIVRHQGKKRLRVVTQSLNPGCWPELLSQFSAQIRENSDPILHETLVCEFSTTTPAIKTAYEVALMDTYQRYFDYGIMCVCGIPRVTLLGNTEDWRRIRARIEVLATYDLEWWTSRLEPILDQFVATSEGNPDRAFWQAIYKPQKAYAAELASGWIADLFPYLFGAPPGSAPQGRGLCTDAAARRNRVLSTPRNDWLLPAPTGLMSGNGVNLKHFPSGLSRAPVELAFPDGSKKDVVLLGGFLGVSQRGEDNALTPVVSWAVAQEN
jgi:Domain of unknown function (DUF4419)